MTSGFSQLHGIMRTVYNQYDSMVRPLRKWLDEHGVKFRVNTRVLDLQCDENDESNKVVALLCENDGVNFEIPVGTADKVFVTLGSMTAGSSLGNTNRPAEFNKRDSSGAWALWKTIATGRPEFGHPGAFSDHVDESKWVSFTATLHDPTLFRLIRDLTGTGGRRTDHVSRFELACVNRSASSATLHRTTRRRRGVLGLRSLRGSPW
jgi:oleate hydratase